MAGHVGVSGDPDRPHRDLPVRVAGLLQSGGSGSRRLPDHQLLRLRLVQRVGSGGCRSSLPIACSRRRRAAHVCASAGGSALQSGRRRVRGVRGGPVRLGAAAHVSGGVLLPGAQAGAGAGEPASPGELFLRPSRSNCDLFPLERLRHPQPRLLQQAVLLRQSQTLRQRRRSGLAVAPGDRLNQVTNNVTHSTQVKHPPNIKNYQTAFTQNLSSS